MDIRDELSDRDALDEQKAVAAIPLELPSRDEADPPSSESVSATPRIHRNQSVEAVDGRD